MSALPLYTQINCCWHTRAQGFTLEGTASNDIACLPASFVAPKQLLHHEDGFHYAIHLIISVVKYF